MSRFRGPCRSLALLLALASSAASVPRTGGVARVYFPVVASEPSPGGLASASDVFLSQCVFEPLVRVERDGTIVPVLARSWVLTELEAADGDLGGADLPASARAVRWSFTLDPLARFPDGQPVRAGDIIASWELLLRSDASPYRWLLDPVAGAREFRRNESSDIEGLVAGDGVLEIRLTRPTPDLLQRLAHPALGVHVVARRSGAAVGPGPFDAGTAGTLIGVNPFHRRGRPYLDGFEMIEPQRVDASLLLESGQADVAVLYGRSADQILTSSTSGIEMKRLPGWDRTYALVWNGQAGEAGSGGLPSKLRGTLGRAAMVRYLFAGRGEAVASLLSDDSAGAEGVASGPLPLGGRVVLLHDAGDPAAISIASRLKAAWEDVNLRVELEPLDVDELRYRLASGDYFAAVVLHHPPTADPVLGLRGTLALLGKRAAPAIDALDFASRLVDPGARLEAARRAEDLLLRDEFLVPLVRVHAWLATSPSLVGVRGEAAGTLRLEDAWWLPGRRIR